ncbi:adenosine 3'-phospho 5'-phosphosulfate transporter 1-like isoform X2 [Daktulosphaira vitifoliae]|nr:adenosine 3'-phospho 5'-phosphosulfate transporter 1-like isoform X2 [Daktulosphaira vitifoliae]
MSLFLPCIKLWFTILVSIIGIVIIQSILASFPRVNQNVLSFHIFLNNCLGYCLVLVPGYWLCKFTRSYDLGDDSKAKKLLKFIFYERSSNPSDNFKQDLIQDIHNTNTFKNDLFTFIYCFGGLQASYLVWGVLQEKMMSESYGSSDNSKFVDAQMLVFLNRGLSTILSAIVLLMNEGISSKNPPPFYKYSYCTLSNIISSWCQYEALKYVSFPTQVLAKTCKIIPVMIMGKLISGKKYQFYEYITAFGIWMGMAIFQYFTANKHSDVTTCVSGIILLIGYLVSDSFTATWQGRIFTQYYVTPLQMVFATSFLSSILTSISLYQTDSFKKTFIFITQHPEFLTDCLMLSVSSACGQLFIFKTISKFGPIVFTIIMTIRQ